MNELTLTNKDKILVGIKWTNSKKNILDIDLMAIMLDENEKLLFKKDFIFFNNLFARNGSIMHTGDNKSGNSSMDDESILINMEKLPPEIKYINFYILNQSYCENSNNYSKISFRISKMNDIFDNVGNDIYKDNILDDNFCLAQIFRISRLSDTSFKGIVDIKSIKTNLEDYLSKYNIKLS